MRQPPPVVTAPFGFVGPPLIMDDAAVPAWSIAFDAVSFALLTKSTAPSTAPSAISFAELTKLSAPSVIPVAILAPVS